MCEAWEDILMQMDLRLTKFVQVSADTNNSISVNYALSNNLKTAPEQCMVLFVMQYMFKICETGKEVTIKYSQEDTPALERKCKGTSVKLEGMVDVLGSDPSSD